MPDHVSRPVRRFEVSTRDELEAEEFVRQMYVGNRMRFHGSHEGARFSATAAEAGGIAVDRIRATVHYSARCDPFDYFFSLDVTRGRVQVRTGRDETIVPAGEAAFYPLGMPLDVDTVDLGVRILRLPLARLEAAAEETAGIAAADLRFESVTPVSAAMGRHWSALVTLACDTLLADNSPAAHPVLAEELARTAAVTALHTFPNTALTVGYEPGPGWVAPRSVRRAAGFIHAHADQPLTMETIAAAAGTGARALQYAFRRYYGITPTGYLRRVRLERADAELRDADPASGLTVAAVACRWGWSKPGQFAAAYRQRFGVLPSHTLRA